MCWVCVCVYVSVSVSVCMCVYFSVYFYVCVCVGVRFLLEEHSLAAAYQISECSSIKKLTPFLH